MAIFTDHRLTIILGLSLNLIFMGIKFLAYICTRLNLFFTDAIDSFTDSFVIFLVVIFLRFDLNNKISFLNMDIMFFCQWCVIIVFRVIIFLEQISDLVRPEKRERPLLVVVISVIMLVGSGIVAILFVDEDDVMKLFISDEEKELRKQYRAQQGFQKKKKGFNLLPIFAEAMDNFITTALALALGLLLYFNVTPQYIYLLDDIGNMAISLLMIIIACRGLADISATYRGKSYFRPVFEIRTLPPVSTSEPPLPQEELVVVKRGREMLV